MVVVRYKGGSKNVPYFRKFWLKYIKTGLMCLFSLDLWSLVIISVVFLRKI